ncbi:phage virion morphogenesis protein [Salmonella enterica]|nr:phage virion morphogenesis protein [Salmonella enterica]EKR1729477.1 phage virion morphogenesis protein [Salmonella enterica subsp. enterica serovar Madelia]
MMQLTVRDGPLRLALKGLAAAGTDMTPLMRAIAGTLSTETAVNFEEEGRPPWVPSLAAQKRDGMTLSDTGHLRRSVTTDYDAHSAVIGTNVEYARIHQLGGTVERKSREVYYPARPYLPVNADGTLQDGVEQKLLNSALKYLQNAARQ